MIYLRHRRYFNISTSLQARLDKGAIEREQSETSFDSAEREAGSNKEQGFVGERYKNISLNDSHSHFNIIDGSVSTSSSGTLNHFNHIKAFLNLAKYGVLAIKMGRAANS